MVKHNRTVLIIFSFSILLNKSTLQDMKFIDNAVCLTKTPLNPPQ